MKTKLLLDFKNKCIYTLIMDRLNSFGTPELDRVIATCACFNFRKASRVVTQHFDDVLKPSRMLITQFTILVAVAKIEAATINELAEILMMDRTTLTRNLKPLEREGWIKSEPGRDKRTRIISLTADGEMALTRALPLWQQAQGQVIEALGEQKWGALLSQLVEATTLIKSE